MACGKSYNVGMKEKLKRAWAGMSFQGRTVAVLVVLVVLVLVVVAVVWPGDGMKRAVKLREQLAGQAKKMVADGGELARGDGHVYAVDVGLLMQWAALAGERELYEQLYVLVDEHLLVRAYGEDADETKGFVAWRYPTKRQLEEHGWGNELDKKVEGDMSAGAVSLDEMAGEGEKQAGYEGWKAMNKAGEPLDASGTTEALRVAEGLWLGAIAFERDEDRQRAEEILEGYVRHQYVDQGVWLIRNYYNFQTGGFSGNSYAIDYDLDFLDMAGQELSNQRIVDVADKTRALLVAAQTDGGLIHSVIQPEIFTLQGRPGAYFSPNNVEQISNVVEVAERSARGLSGAARGVLDFCMNDFGRLSLYYDAGSGRRVGHERAGLETLAPLGRLAVKLREDEAHNAVMMKLVQRARWKFAGQRGGSLYDVAQTLLSLEVSLQYVGEEKTPAFEAWLGEVEEEGAAEQAEVVEQGAGGEADDAGVTGEESEAAEGEQHKGDDGGAEEKKGEQKRGSGGLAEDVAGEGLILPVVVEEAGTQGEAGEVASR